ncbi:hypothetical protein [Bradyrhizobium sp. LTSP857]|uniref:hypothetical protein n=1 Tax=Bradyrhizobium sp. LTSP857 TaxID=1619231 RepID=UPI0005D20639|nr:hypothetical protein [Bradyrhizobium sp. LTSP857]KJC36468.1 hypothetical protein UP06_32650 [Bradyrhizobium sp. LTSP857]
MPIDPRTEPTTLARYFDYGRSIEGKLTKMIGSTDAKSNRVVLAGWIENDCAPIVPPPPSGKVGVSIYGMSFSKHIASELNAIDPNLPITSYGGPAAGFNHSYACYKAANSNEQNPNKIQIIGILASSVNRMLTLGGLTTSFEAPQPFSYPRYLLAHDELHELKPVVQRPDDLRDAAKMHAYLDQLAQEDAYYDPALFYGGLLDRSVIFRFLRRAYAHARTREIDMRLINNGVDFRPNPEVGPVMKAMLRDFAKSARNRDQIPMVILFQDQGTGSDSLYRLLGHDLEQYGLAFVRSDQIASAADPRNFITDGHFTPAVDHKIAEAVYDKIKYLASGIPR